jgi:hypothetical protein
MSIPAQPTDPPPPPTPSWLKQVYTLLRYAGVSAGTAGTIGALLNVADPATIHAIVAQFQMVADDLTKLFGDSWKLGYLAFPIVAVWLAKIGVKSSSTPAQVAAVQALLTAQVVTTDPDLAKTVPGVIHAAVLPTK